MKIISQLTLSINTLLITTLLTAAFAKSEMTEHKGGNGGNGIAILLDKKIPIENLSSNSKPTFTSAIKVMSNIKTALLEEYCFGQKNYSFALVDKTEFIKMLNEVNLETTNKTLTDKFGQSVTCLNDPTTQTILCNENDFLTLTNTSLSAAVILFAHELLNLVGIELGDKDEPSSYHVSRYILEGISQTILEKIHKSEINQEE